jgi:3-oxoacyl-[acyl-carrier protein] reductase
MDKPDVLITGAARGIGRATAIAFAQRGGRVAINYLSDAAAAQEAAQLARRAGASEALVVQADVADGPAVRDRVDELGQRWGKLDVVVNNAGYGCSGTLEAIDEADWDRAFAVHVKGAFHVCRAAIPWLEKSAGGVIVNTSSVAALRGLNGAIAYGCVKATLLQFTRCLAWELADRNIRVNAICPGIVRTDFHAKMSQEQKQHNLDNRIPLHKEGEPEQIAHAVMALADNPYITGESLTVDGGLTMRIC